MFPKKIFKKKKLETKKTIYYQALKSKMLINYIYGNLKM